MAENFLRTVIVTLEGGSSLTIRGGGDTDLRIRGAVRQWGAQTPNMGSVRIYNVSRQTAQKFKEGMTVSIQAGYERGSVGQIFRGEIKQQIYGHENATDTYVELFLADSQFAYEASRVGSTLAAGHTPMDRANLAVKAMQANGVTGLGVVNVDLSQPASPRGAAFVGMARDVLRTVAFAAGATWSIQDGKVDIVDQRKPVPGGAVKLTPASGLIGWPKQTSEGLEITSLINSQLKPHVNVQIDASQIQLAERNNAPSSVEAARSNAFLDDQNILSGTYNIFHLDRFFDTRGQEFYDVSLSVGSGAQAPQSQGQQGYYTLTTS